MPRLPQYQRSVSAQGGGFVPAGPQATAEHFGAGQARMKMAFGGALASAGFAMIDLFETRQKRIDETCVRNARVALDEEYRKWAQEWEQNNQGLDASEYENATREWFDAYNSRTQGTLRNRRQREMWDVFHQNAAAGAMRNAARHSHIEVSKAEALSREAENEILARQMESAAGARDFDEALMVSLAMVDANVRANWKGQSEETVSVKRQDAARTVLERAQAAVGAAEGPEAAMAFLDRPGVKTALGSKGATLRAGWERQLAATERQTQAARETAEKQAKAAEAAERKTEIEDMAHDAADVKGADGKYAIHDERAARDWVRKHFNDHEERTFARRAIDAAIKDRDQRDTANRLMEADTAAYQFVIESSLDSLDARVIESAARSVYPDDRERRDEFIATATRATDNRRKGDLRERTQRLDEAIRQFAAHDWNMTDAAGLLADAFRDDPGMFGQLMDYRNKYGDIGLQADWGLYDELMAKTPEEAREALKDDMFGVSRRLGGGFLWDAVKRHAMGEGRSSAAARGSGAGSDGAATFTAQDVPAGWRTQAERRLAIAWQQERPGKNEKFDPKNEKHELAVNVFKEQFTTRATDLMNQLGRKLEQREIDHIIDTLLSPMIARAPGWIWNTDEKAFQFEVDAGMYSGKQLFQGKRILQDGDGTSRTTSHKLHMNPSPNFPEEINAIFNESGEKTIIGFYD